MKQTVSRRPCTRTFTLHMIRLGCRAAILVCMLCLYLNSRERLEAAFFSPHFFSRFGLPQALWCLLVLGALAHLFPPASASLSGRKCLPAAYRAPHMPVDQTQLLQYVRLANRKAVRVMILWLGFNSIFAVLYLLRIIGRAEMLMLTVFYFFSDLFCMMVYCPFQSLIMKNRCCISCRIFDWAHFMMYTPMVFVKSFFGWSLFLIGCIILVRWELLFLRHPERFWTGSNAALHCQNCTEQLCRIKKPLPHVYRRK